MAPDAAVEQLAVSAIKARTMRESSLDIYIATTSISALRLCFFGIRAAVSGRAMWFVFKYNTLYPKAQQGSLVQTVPAAATLILGDQCFHLLSI